MKKEKRKMRVDEEVVSNEGSDAVGAKVKKKKRKVNPDELESCDHSKPADVSPLKKRKKSIAIDRTPNNAVDESKKDIISTKNVKRKHRKDTETEHTSKSELPAEKPQKKSKKHATVAAPSSEEKKKVSPSEAAAKRKVKQKKRARKAAKKAKKLEEKTSIGAESEVDAKAESLALEYLRLWHGRRGEWSFQKVRQVWLLQHLYDTDKMSDADFALMLKYIDGLKGYARSLTVMKAEKLLVAASSSDEEEEDDSEKKPSQGEKLTKEQEERTRAVLQMLA